MQRDMCKTMDDNEIVAVNESQVRGIIIREIIISTEHADACRVYIAFIFIIRGNKILILCAHINVVLDARAGQ